MNGREEILEALGRARVVDVFGLPGVGKTAALESIARDPGAPTSTWARCAPRS
jgi:putative protein kinase ArgK-like GTPase of G3E family